MTLLMEFLYLCRHIDRIWFRSVAIKTLNFGKQFVHAHDLRSLPATNGYNFIGTCPIGLFDSFKEQGNYVESLPVPGLEPLVAESKRVNRLYQYLLNSV